MKKYLFFIWIGLAGLYSCNNNLSTAKYEMTPEEALIYTSSNDSDALAPEVLASLVYGYTPDASYQFVDLRSPNLFDAGHLPNAVNVPLGKLMNTENCQALISANKTNIIYGDTRDQVVLAANVLKQVGFWNFYYVKADYNYLKNNILDAYKIHAAPYDAEAPLYDYAKVVAQTAGAGSASSAAPKPAVSIKRKKKESAGGGCD